MDGGPLLERFSDHVSADGGKDLYRFVDDKGKTVKSFTYASFNDATSRLASALVAPDGWALAPGSSVLLVYPPGLDFIVAFVACLKAGLVAVPVYPPRPGLSKDLTMFVAVQADCKATVALTNSLYDFAKRVTAFKQFFTGSKAKFPALTWHVTDEGALPRVKASYEETVPAAAPGSTAFLQYTSGSTSKPKGVVISHGNLAHNLACIVHALRASPATVVVSWLPQYHDMGLIGSYLGVAYCGGSGAYMSPFSFVKSPPLWIETAAKFSATHLQAPNFAYKLVVRKWLAKYGPGKQPGVDLSAVQHIFNAAEPIEDDAIDAFVDLFRPMKLSEAAMSPGYGLAENTVYVCDGGRQRLCVHKQLLETDRVVRVLDEQQQQQQQQAEGGGRREGVVLVGCGDPHRFSELSDIQVRIVDEKTRRPEAEGRVGEIWVASASKAESYFGLAAKTKEDLHAKLDVSKLDGSADADADADDDDDDGGGGGASAAVAQPGDGERSWLRTGDLGFLHSGELFVCGRLKDLIIVRGRNHYPQDIEHTVEAADGAVRPGCVAAFSIAGPNGEGEYLGLAAEVRDAKMPGIEKLSQKLRQKIVAEHGVAPYVVVLLKDRSIPKTTSGKISRHRARLAFEAGELVELHRWVGDIVKHPEQQEVLADQGSMRREGDVEGGEEGGEGEEGEGVSATASATAMALEGAGASEAATTAPTLIGQGSGTGGVALAGDDLLHALKEEVARLLESEPDGIDEGAALLHLGMDSVILTQFKGILQASYKVDMDEEELFDEDCSLDYVRRRVEGEPKLTKFSGGAPAAAAQDGSGSGSGAVPKPKKPKKPKQNLFGCFKVCGC